MPHKYLGLVPQLATGIRLPDIVLPPILEAFKMYDSIGTLMLSYHRETAPTDVIREETNVLKGHTGTSISEYISKAIRYSDIYDILVQVEADHVSLMASPERAIKRIAGGSFEYGLSDSEIIESLNYIEREFKEASESGGVDFVTIDTCELIDLSVNKMDIYDLEAMYEERLDSDLRRELEKRYLDRVFKFVIDNDTVLYLKFSREDLIRLALKYLKSIEYIDRILSIIRKYIIRPFGIEIALDELPEHTKIKDLVFYLLELKRRGLDPDFIAPNIGFMKREDFKGDLKDFAQKLRLIHGIVKNFGSLISFHSGSGAHPYSDKGLGVWSTIRKVTGGAIKYKVSGVYIQLLLEVMSRFPKGSGPRRLYEEIYQVVLDTLEKYVLDRKGLYSPHLETMIKHYRETIERDPAKKMDPRADFFRHYFFLFQAVRDNKGVRYLREELLDLYSRDQLFREIYRRESIKLTTRMLLKLGLAGNAMWFNVLHK